MKSILEKRRIFLYVTLPVLAWAAAIAIVSSIPGRSLPEIGLWQWDKLAHLAEYIVLSCLLYRYFHCRWAMAPQRVWAMSAALGLGYAALDEIHQLAIPMRFCTWQDLVADAAGIASGIVIMKVFYEKRG
jgi:VanZ family protein